MSASCDYKNLIRNILVRKYVHIGRFHTRSSNMACLRRIIYRICISIKIDDKYNKCLRKISYEFKILYLVDRSSQRWSSQKDQQDHLLDHQVPQKNHWSPQHPRVCYLLSVKKYYDLNLKEITKAYLHLSKEYHWHTLHHF